MLQVLARRIGRQSGALRQTAGGVQESHAERLCAHPRWAGAFQQLRGFAGDSHDDFKPQYKDASSSSAIDTIEQDLKSHKVFVYMKVAG